MERNKLRTSIQSIDPHQLRLQMHLAVQVFCVRGIEAVTSSITKSLFMALIFYFVHVFR